MYSLLWWSDWYVVTPPSIAPPPPPTKEKQPQPQPTPQPQSIPQPQPQPQPQPNREVTLDDFVESVFHSYLSQDAVRSSSEEVSL